MRSPTRLALAAATLLLAVGPAWAAEDYICTNHGKPYPVSFDREKRTFSISGKPADVEHMEWASAVVEIRGMVDLGNTFFWAELNNLPSIIYMRDQKIVRTDRCRFVDKPPA